MSSVSSASTILTSIVDVHAHPEAVMTTVPPDPDGLVARSCWVRWRDTVARLVMHLLRRWSAGRCYALADAAAQLRAIRGAVLGTRVAG